MKSADTFSLNLCKSADRLPAALTIAGSDSGGGAGIQADLKTFAALGVFGTTAITCLTAQNPTAVSRIDPVDPKMVAAQIRMVCEAFPVKAAKTGMLYSAGIIKSVARAVKKHRISRLVVDPVMIATSGANLLRGDAIAALYEDLLPLASVITPNIQEAEILADMEICTVLDMQIAAESIGRRWKTAVVVKGGHLGGRTVVNVLYDRGTMRTFELQRIKTGATHGTGCTFSAAITAGLARGLSLPEAVEQAGRFVARALTNAVPVGRFKPLNILPLVPE